MLVRFKGAFEVDISLESTVIVLGPTHSILAPRALRISQEILTSLIFGTFSIVQIPSIKRVAGKIATAAFFAPLITTSPLRGEGPVTTNLSI